MSIDNRIVTIARWLGRILSVLLLSVVAAFAVGEGMPRPLAISPRELTICTAVLAMLVGLMFLFCWCRTPGSSTLPIHQSLGESLRKRKSWFYRIALPSVWLVAALLSWTHPGDEYGLFMVACLPTVWIAEIASLLHYTNLRGVLPIMLATGVIMMSLAGWLMDTLRVWRSLWLPLFVLGTLALVWCGLSEYPSYARAMAKNGSLTAYVSAATNLSLYLSVILSVPVALLSDSVDPPDN